MYRIRIAGLIGDAFRALHLYPDATVGTLLQRLLVSNNLHFKAITPSAPKRLRLFMELTIDPVEAWLKPFVQAANVEMSFKDVLFGDLGNKQWQPLHLGVCVCVCVVCPLPTLPPAQPIACPAYVTA